MCDAVLEGRARAQQLDASRRFERLLRLRAAAAASDAADAADDVPAAAPVAAPTAAPAAAPTAAPAPHGSWVVLVGGEWGGAMRPDEKRTRPGAWLGSHTSLQAS